MTLKKIEAYTRGELDDHAAQVPCDCEGPCTGHGIVLKPPCHAEAACRVHYFGGRLYIACAECETLITAIAVATKDEGIDPLMVGVTIN